jgi:hypothetical protein
MISIKKKIYFTLFCFAVILGVLIRIEVLPLLKQLERNSEFFSLQKKALTVFQAQLESFKNFQKDLPLYQSVLERVEKSFVAKDAPIEFIEFLEKEARTFNLFIKISPSEALPTKEDPWIPVGFSVSVGGEFSNCLKFLERLEKSPFLIAISQLNIVRISEKNLRLKEFENLKPGDVSLRLNLKVFSPESSD